MSHRCDDNWFWLSLMLIASQSDIQQPSSSDSSRRRYWIDDDASWSGPRAAQPARPGPRVRRTQAFAVGLVSIAIVIVIAGNRTPANKPTATPAPDLVVMAIPAGANSTTPPLLPADSDSTPTPIGSFPESLETRLPEVPLLTSTALANGDPFLLTDVAAPESTLLSTRFDIGSTREEVEAAQGRPPTFSARGGTYLWWGSSKVMFTRDGRVEGWVDGSPPLMIRR